MINYFFLGFSFLNIINLWIFFIYRISFNQLQSLFSLMPESLHLNYGRAFRMVPMPFDATSWILESFLAFWESNIISQTHFVPSCSDLESVISMKSLVLESVFRNCDLVLRVITLLYLLVIISEFYSHKLKGKKSGILFSYKQTQFPLMSVN